MTNETKDLQAFTLEQKADILFNIVVNECYCSMGIFIENVGSKDKIKRDLTKLNTVGEIKHYVNQYI